MITRKQIHEKNIKERECSSNARVNQILEIKRWKIDENSPISKTDYTLSSQLQPVQKLLRKMDRPLLGLDYKSFKCLIC